MRHRLRLVTLYLCTVKSTFLSDHNFNDFYNFLGVLSICISAVLAGKNWECQLDTTLERVETVFKVHICTRRYLHKQIYFINDPKFLLSIVFGALKYLPYLISDFMY